MKIARRFNAGGAANARISPEGTAEWAECSEGDVRFRWIEFQPSLRDLDSADDDPGVETPGYFRDVPSGQMSVVEDMPHLRGFEVLGLGLL